MAAKDSETPKSEADVKDVTDKNMADQDATGIDTSDNDTNDNDTNDNDTSDITNLSYEQARDELISIVSQLEGGQLGLEESMTLWQRGEALANHCNTWLDGAEAKLTTGSRTRATEG